VLTAICAASPSAKLYASSNAGNGKVIPSQNVDDRSGWSTRFPTKGFQSIGDSELLQHVGVYNGKRCQTNPFLWTRCKQRKTVSAVIYWVKRASGRQSLTFVGWLDPAQDVKPQDLIKTMK